MAFLRAPRKNVPRGANAISLTGLLWRYRDGALRGKSHIRVIGTAATLGRNPNDILIGVLDVAGFAVNAILGIDHEFRAARFLHPFINAGRAVTRRRSREHVVFRFFLQRQVPAVEMNRLVLLMVCIREKYR